MMISFNFEDPYSIPYSFKEMYSYFLLDLIPGWEPWDVVPNVLDFDIVVSGFELQVRFYFYFQTW